MALSPVSELPASCRSPFASQQTLPPSHPTSRSTRPAARPTTFSQNGSSNRAPLVANWLEGTGLPPDVLFSRFATISFTMWGPSRLWVTRAGSLSRNATTPYTTGFSRELAALSLRGCHSISNLITQG